MVRMSDLVRGTGRAAGPPAAPAPPASPPPAEPEAPTGPARLRLGGLARAQAGAPGPEESPPSSPPSPAADDETSRATAEALFDELQGFLTDLRTQTSTDAAFPWAELEQLVNRALQSLEASAALFWIANRTEGPTNGDALAVHHARVAVLALRLGANLDRPRDDLIATGLAGCLMDVGLWHMGAGLLRRLEALTPEEQTQYRVHPRLGAERIRRWSPPGPEIADMVLQHHEREQGQGFPQGLTGAAIHPGAKILGLADTYTALTAPTSSRPGLPSHDAIREIVRAKHESFPPALIKALLSEISVFPPGTLVRLNTGEVGCVVGVNRNHPLRPRVEVYDAKGRRLSTPKVIDLSESPFVYISGSLSEAAR